MRGFDDYEGETREHRPLVDATVEVILAGKGGGGGSVLVSSLVAEVRFSAEVVSPPAAALATVLGRGSH